MKKPKWYYCDLWRVNIYYFIGWDFNSFCKYMLKHHSYEVDQSITPIGKCVMLPQNLGGQFCIWVKGKNDMESLVHECIHAANRLTERAGYRTDQYNDEAYAYLVTNIFRQARKNDN